MADADLLLIYRSLDSADLQARKAKLLASITTYSSQTVGQKSFTKDLRHFRDQLAAITFVLNERGGDYVHTIITDFSVSGQKGSVAGTIDNF